MVNGKHLATFLLGAAAGAAFLKYQTMDEEEKEELTGKFKQKAEEFKTEAGAATDKMDEYFKELQTKGGDAMKDLMANAEEFMTSVFNQEKTDSKEKEDTETA